MTEFTLDVHPNKCQLFKAWYLFFFFFWITGVLCTIKSKTKIDFKSSLIHYLDHVWLLDPVSLHTNSSVCPFTPPSSDRQPCLLRCKINHSKRCQPCFFCLLLLHLTFIAVQPAPGDLGRFLISEIVGNSRFPSGHISVSAPRRSNLAPAERYFYWFLLWSHSQCLSRFRKQQLLFHPFFLNIFLHHVFNCKR